MRTAGCELRKVMAIRLTPAERACVKAKATEAGLPPATFVRQVALGTVVSPPAPIPEVNRETYLELAKMGGNLNQVAHHLNAGMATGVDEAFVRRLAEVVKNLALRVIELEGKAP
jgi:hypothetical protein